MQFTEKHFVYDGINSRRYGLFFAHIDTEPFKKISGTPTYQKNFYNNTKTNSIVGTKWDESPISTEVEILSENPISKKELREIEKWLFNRPQYCKLYIDKREDEDIEVIDGEEKQCYIECLFYETEVIEYIGGIYGFKAIMELSSPFALQDSIIKTIDSNSNDEYTEVVINVDTDDGDYVYPITTIKCNDDVEEFEIINTSDKNRCMKVSPFNPIVLTGESSVMAHLSRGENIYIRRDIENDTGYKKLYIANGDYISFSKDFLLNNKESKYFFSGEQLKVDWDKISSETSNSNSDIIIYTYNRNTATNYQIRFLCSRKNKTVPTVEIYDSNSGVIIKTIARETNEFTLPPVGYIEKIQSVTFDESGLIVSDYYDEDIIVNQLLENTYFWRYSSYIYWYLDNEEPTTRNEAQYTIWSNADLYVLSGEFENKNFILDSRIGTVIKETSNGDCESYYNYLVNQIFLRLCNGENILKILGKINLSIEFQQKRFIR